MVLINLGGIWINPDHIAAIMVVPNSKMRTLSIKFIGGIELTVYEPSPAWDKVQQLIKESEYVKTD